MFSASGKLFGLELSIVREVLQPPEVTKIPNMLAHILGVYNLRGTIITLVDIRQILGLDQNKDKKSDMVILLKNGDFTISFIVDRVGRSMRFCERGFLIRTSCTYNCSSQMARPLTK